MNANLKLNKKTQNMEQCNNTRNEQHITNTNKPWTTTKTI